MSADDTEFRSWWKEFSKEFDLLSTWAIAKAAFLAGQRAAQQSVQADGLCPNCGKDYFVEETIVDGELRCSCARR